MFRFTIRDVLWLTALCAVAIYAYGDRRKTRLRIAASQAEQASERAKLELSRAKFERERAMIHASLADSQAHLNRQAQEMNKEAQQLNKEAQKMARDTGEIYKLQEKLKKTYLMAMALTNHLRFRFPARPDQHRRDHPRNNESPM